MKSRFIPVWGVFFAVLVLCSACSINKMAIRAVSNALTGEGSNTVFTGDPDPELVGDALPFAIKMYETLLSSNPGHEGLILTTGSLFIMYANAFIQGPADFLPVTEYEKRLAALERAKKFYLRGADILYGGIDKKYPGFSGASSADGTLEPYLARMKKADVPLLYWTAAGYLSAYSLDPFDLTLGRRVPDLMFLIDRAYALDPDFNNGALDEFYILALSSLPESMGGDKTRAAAHFNRALEKSRGLLAGPYVSYAQAVSIPAQDYDTFKAYLEKALALDVDADPGSRLMNIIAQRKAQSLLDTASDYFIDIDDGEAWISDEY
ncbi:MAG: TRAP transporter TatT component family protein [Spirochaetaceae bacterium]|jgi:predicted anti-sigma-YlaC factor YlaD|nr:TRAP transporter TatT component family protein [Spirochaetaceae bacterium]